MKLAEWLTIAAIILGPILALSAQRVLDLLREKSRQRLGLFMRLIATRADYLSAEHVRALNTIDLVFNRPRDVNVRQAWKRILEHVATSAMTPTGAPTPGWLEKYNDLKVDLFQAMGAAVGYTFTADELKRQIYTPIAHGQVEAELAHIRQTLNKVLTDDGLKVKIVP